MTDKKAMTETTDMAIPATPKARRSAKAWVGTAVGVGSAAVVAALLYARRRK